MEALLDTCGQDGAHGRGKRRERRDFLLHVRRERADDEYDDDQGERADED